MKKIVMLGLIVSLFPVMGYAHDIGKTHEHIAPPTWEERQAKIKTIVDAEIERRHELEIQRIKSEVYAKELRLKASNMIVSAYATNRNKITQENTASASA